MRKKKPLLEPTSRNWKKKRISERYLRVRNIWCINYELYLIMLRLGGEQNGQGETKEVTEQVTQYFSQATALFRLTWPRLWYVKI